MSRPASPERQLSQAKEKAKLEGESEGITLGKIQERNLIVKWMRRQTSTEAWRLAKLIEIGIHTETS